MGNHDAIVEFCRSHDVGLVVVGPEQPLVEGVADSLRAADIPTFGPSKAAAQLEGSKGFVKDLCARENIPTAAYKRFSDKASAHAALPDFGLPVVIKADGLAAGKGVIIAETADQATAAIEDMFSGSFGEAGAEIVIEQFLTGEEASFFALTDGETVIPFGSAQDHKRVGDGDTGPNTGGMGAYSPAPVVTPEVHARVMRDVINPTVQGMIREGHPYTGFLYAGLMITPDGAPKVIEFNCRFGDPETQPIMVRLQSSLVELVERGIDKKLDATTAQWDERAALGVVMAAGGYPGDIRKGDAIAGLDQAATLPGKVFHAGTALKDGKVVTSGGRVLCATALGKTVSEAQQNAYALVQQVSWEGEYHRNDIGYRAVEREQGK